MIQEFTQGVYTYRLASPALTLSKVKLNGVDISKYLSNQSQVGWYDVSKNSGRLSPVNIYGAADGKMILNVISEKFRLDLVTRQLTRDEVVDFFTQIRIRPAPITVQFLNPFTNSWKTITCYRGDRSAQPAYPVEVTETIDNVSTKTLVEMFNPISQAIIEL